MRVSGFPLAVLIALLFSTLQTARADSVQVTADQTVATLTEGQSLVVTYTAVISASGTDPSASVEIFPATVDSQLDPSGDLSDLLVVGSVVDNCSGLYFAMNNGGPANTCADQVTYVPASDTGAENFDFGSATAELVLDLQDTATLENDEGTADTVYTVNDVPSVGVPEPSILPLVTGGFFVLGFARVFRRP
jgi:hypothetical protein